MTANNSSMSTQSSPAAGEDEVSTTITALSAGFKPPAQPDTVPSWVAKMNTAGRIVPGTRNADEGFHTIPVGVAGAGFGGLFASTAWQEIGRASCRERV